jgi:UDP-2-acetamido-3-amino-2,3-dideoxy-glucuronate N-acetyltransferase
MRSKDQDRVIAIIGTGYWGKNLVRNFHALGVLHSICDVNSETVEALRARYPDVASASSYSDILADAQIRGVVIATPASTHADMIRQALLAGKDVYVEKPLCLTEHEGIDLNNYAQEREQILMVGHLLWYHPAVLKLKELIDTGDLGRIQYIYSNRLNLGKLRREENVLWSFAPHDVSVILGLVGEMPESILTQGGNYLHAKLADATVSLLSFASGTRAHIFVSWLHPFKEQKLVVVGDRKMAVFDDTVLWSQKLQLYPHTVEWSAHIPVANKAAVEYVEVPEMEPLRAECLHFLECIKTRQSPRTDGKEGLQVLRVLNACQAALEQQTAITLGEVSPPIKEYFVHETAVIDNGAEVGRGTKIWHFSHILTGSKVGERCNIGQNVVIGPNVSIGHGCKIQNNVSIYDGVTLEDNIFCGPSVVFTNVLNPRAHIPRKNKYIATLVKHGTTIGANATVVCGHTLGKYSFIAAGSVVTRDVLDYALVVGNPAYRVGWMCACGERLPENLICTMCDAKYRETEQGLAVLS